MVPSSVLITFQTLSILKLFILVATLWLVVDQKNLPCTCCIGLVVVIVVVYYHRWSFRTLSSASVLGLFTSPQVATMMVVVHLADALQ